MTLGVIYAAGLFAFCLIANRALQLATALPAGNARTFGPGRRLGRAAYLGVGNIQTVTHTAPAGGWTRTYAYDEPTSPPANNRLTATTKII